MNLCFSVSPDLLPYSPSLSVSWEINYQVKEKGRALPVIQEVIDSSQQYPRALVGSQPSWLSMVGPPRTEHHPVTNTQ